MCLQVVLVLVVEPIKKVDISSLPCAALHSPFSASLRVYGVMQ